MNTMEIKKLPTKLITFLKEVHLELKKVNWPTREETFKYTLIVIGICIVTAAFLGGLDVVFNRLLEKYVL
jgi:preprotein translocase subunit SecE